MGVWESGGRGGGGGGGGGGGIFFLVWVASRKSTKSKDMSRSPSRFQLLDRRLITLFQDFYY